MVGLGFVYVIRDKSISDCTAKNMGGLKTDMRAKHTRDMNKKDYTFCIWCIFHSLNESELEKHVTGYNFRHNDDCDFKNKNIQKVKSEIAEMKVDGFILKYMAMAEFQQEHIRKNMTYSRIYYF